MNYISEGSVSHINGEVCSCSQMRASLHRRLSPLMVYYKTFGILTPRTSWLPSRCHSVIMPTLAAFDDETPLTECALKICVNARLF